jgi:hypothetical protein
MLPLAVKTTNTVINSFSLLVLTVCKFNHPFGAKTLPVLGIRGYKEYPDSSPLRILLGSSNNYI